MMVVGAITDTGMTRKVTAEDGLAVADAFGVPFGEVNTVTGHGVEDVFRAMVAVISVGWGGALSRGVCGADAGAVGLLNVSRAVVLWLCTSLPLRLSLIPFPAATPFGRALLGLSELAVVPHAARLGKAGSRRPQRNRRADQDPAPIALPATARSGRFREQPTWRRRRRRWWWDACWRLWW